MSLSNFKQKKNVVLPPKIFGLVLYFHVRFFLFCAAFPGLFQCKNHFSSNAMLCMISNEYMNFYFQALT